MGRRSWKHRRSRRTVDKGLVKSIGVSNYNLEQLIRAVEISTHPIAAVQLLFNILNRSTATPELLNYCRKKRITVVAHTPLAGKSLADRSENKVILKIAAKYEKTPAQVALNWLLSQAGVVVIPKAVEQEHIEENLGALEFEMSADDINSLYLLGRYK